MAAHRLSILFPFAFLFVLVACLTLSVAASSFVVGDALPVSGASVYAQLQIASIIAVYFLVLSGYLPLFLLSFFVFARRTDRRNRLAIHLLLFAGCYLVFSHKMTDGFSTLVGVLLAAGLVSVLIADFAAERMDRMSSNPGSESIRLAR